MLTNNIFIVRFVENSGQGLLIILALPADIARNIRTDLILQRGIVSKGMEKYLITRINEKKTAAIFMMLTKIAQDIIRQFSGHCPPLRALIGRERKRTPKANKRQKQSFLGILETAAPLLNARSTADINQVHQAEGIPTETIPGSVPYIQTKIGIILIFKEFVNFFIRLHRIILSGNQMIIVVSTPGSRKLK